METGASLPRRRTSITGNIGFLRTGGMCGHRITSRLACTKFRHILTVFEVLSYWTFAKWAVRNPQAFMLHAYAKMKS